MPDEARVLLVEDSRTIAMFARTPLEDIGCNVVFAKDAGPARNWL